MSSYAADLDRLHGDALVTARSGVALASSRRISSPEHPLHRFGLGVGRGTPSDGEELDRFAGGLLGLHRDLLRQGIDHAMTHLGGRTSQGSSLLDRQLVQTALADVAVEVRENAVLPTGDAHARWRAHQGLVDAGRLLLSLLGASSFLVSGPGGDLHLAEVTGNVYLHPDRESA
ncbi:hypothetical protein BBK82_35015 [Lentzea guizhouensis]|uniref:Acyl-CoA dehydrogenase/oxidase C-terminal domain-containing protein n=1 Tax=Lentzea guizhouensis TaxID=1586287 RepID=A0A1B2HRY7_9PSEU|nr:hypothetical protein [Lentzea guizhouensis]ANZ40455.1 hypothetical protein BBK82_35015 [Lentzea guizhouensis]